ncbi:MAG TPA: succinate dehydrogenase, hydrophobic membrane anchor protein [Alphaproteobacteria bacterium]|nr:succinate dehydrogenase, hydrophobic membrane anchor protein [Alphaproteobacteria bacterium]
MSQKKTSMRTATGRARGLGSAKEGVGHWWAMRITSIALIPLGLWLMISLLTLIGAEHAQAHEWLHNPYHAVLMLLFLLFGLHHSAHGMQVVVEDYISTPWLKHWSLIKNTLLHLAAAGFAIFAVLYVVLK